MRRKAAVICTLALILLAISAFFLIPQIKQYFYPREYSEYVTEYSDEYNVPEPLIYAVIYTESKFDQNAVSSAGAVGLMQLMPDTMDWLSRLKGESAPTGDIADPKTNIKYGTYYLSYLYDRFGNWETAIAAYNAGHGRVGGWLEDSRYSDDGITLKTIPITETKNYVNRVAAAMQEYTEIYYNGEY